MEEKMNIKNTFWLMLAFFIIIFTSCSESKITELDETVIDFSEIGYQLNWDHLIKSHDYHLDFSYSDNRGWSAHLLGYKWETKPTATLKINNQKIDIRWYSLYNRELIPPPWHQGYISIEDLNLQSGEEISIELKSSKGVSKFRYRLPAEKPQIINTPSFYKPDEDFTFEWELFQIEDFQAVSVSVPYSDNDLTFNWELSQIEDFQAVSMNVPNWNFRSLPVSTRNYNIPANSLIKDEYLEYISIFIYNVSVKSSGNQTHIVTAMRVDGKWLEIEFE